MHFALGDIYKRSGLIPQLIKDGNRLYQVRIHRKKGLCPQILFRDSYNWLQHPLAKLPATLGLSIEDKGWFPYLFNQRRNLHLQLDNLPDKRFYAPFAMKPDRALDFYHFYYVNAVLKRTPFCLKDALVEYCLQDVRILAHAIVKFRRMFLDITHDDVIENTMTAAGACMRYYCSAFLKEGQRDIAIIPENGYAKMTRQSQKALKFIKWLAHKRQLPIQHRDSVRGEHRYREYLLDGYVDSSVSYVGKC
jgi:hypothetical protein